MKKIPNWLWGMFIAEAVFIICFISLGGFSGKQENYGILLVEVPALLFLPFIDFIYSILFNANEGLSFFLNPAKEPLLLFFILSIAYLLIGIFIGGISNVKKFFSRNSWGRINWVWFISLVFLILSICLGIYKGYQNNRYNKLFEESRDPSSIEVCNKLPDSYSKNSCFRKMSEKKLDASICDLMVGQDIEALSQKSECYATISVKTKDVSVCSKIDLIFKYSMSKCLSVKCRQLPNFSEEANRCYYDVAIRTKDKQMCFEIFDKRIGTAYSAGPLEKQCEGEVDK